MGVSGPVLQSFRNQIKWCQALGSPFTARLLHQALQDLERGGLLAELIDDWPGNPVEDALPLRLAGALHVLVLSGASTALSAVYPPHETDDDAALGAAVSKALEDHRQHILSYLAKPPQTNEMRRSAMLLGGFLEIHRIIGLPMRLLEIGASAGLNSIWDRYRYQLGSACWGNPDSPVTISTDWSGPLPVLQNPVIESRAACDRAPVDISDDDHCARLRSYIWPDQADRLQRLTGAIALARQIGVKVETADAADWLERQFGSLPQGVATVLFHTVMWQYLPVGTKEAIRGLLNRAGQNATWRQPLAWLRYEPGESEGPFELRLTIWPGGQERLLATGHPHGASIRWHGSAQG